MGGHVTGQSLSGIVVYSTPSSFGRGRGGFPTRKSIRNKRESIRNKTKFFIFFPGKEFVGSNTRSSKDSMKTLNEISYIKIICLPKYKKRKDRK